MKGLFITVEGIDGAGKTTHVRWLRDFFERRGRTVVTTREPGGTSLGEALRALLLDSDHPIDPETEALLMFAARREHLARVVMPALGKGDVVISDRFTDATFAYQGWGRGVDIEKLEALERVVQGELQPDLTLLFDVPPDVARERASKTRAPDRFERERAEFFERVRAGYLERARLQPKRFRIVDATRSVAEVDRELERLLTGLELE
jgi:dTMP kinase